MNNEIHGLIGSWMRIAQCTKIIFISLNSMLQIDCDIPKQKQYVLPCIKLSWGLSDLTKAWYVSIHRQLASTTHMAAYWPHTHLHSPPTTQIHSHDIPRCFEGTCYHTVNSVILNQAQLYNTKTFRFLLLIVFAQDQDNIW